MAVTDDPPKPDPPLLRRIDLAAFSQSELRTLCAISNARLKISNSDDIVIPQINTAVFNECASARKQTYSPRKRGSGVAGPRRRFSSHVAPSESDDGSLRESRLIVGFFKQYMQNRGKNVEIPETRKRRAENPDGGSAVQIVNRNGVSVDLRKLEAISDPYGGELRRRTAGMETEEELLGFLKSLEGKWCSTRKKRRIVDASLLGDALPVGWKIVIALKRKAGRFSPFCRRYISPTGEHLPSCKEVAAYLSSYLASSDMNLSGEALVESQGVVSEKVAGTNPVGLCSTQDISNSTKHPPSLPVVYEDAAVSGVDNVSDAQVRGFFECYKCKLKFSEKDAYVKHLLSSHENAPKRYRMGSPIGKGVIFRDGKYECQFCHKVFLDKKRYTCHVGVHVRNFNRGSEQLFDVEAIKCTEQSSVDKMPSELSKMDALLAIAESSAEAMPGSVSEKVSDADSLVARRNSAIDSPKLEMETTGKTAKNVIEVPSPVGEIRQILVGDKEMGIDDHQSIVYSDKISIAPFNEEIHNALAKVIPFEVSALQHQGAKSTCDLHSWTDPASTCTTHEKRVDSLESFVTGFNKASASFTDVGSAPSSTSTMPQKFRSIRASPKSGGSSGDSHSNIISAYIAPQMSINTAPETRKGNGEWNEWQATVLQERNVIWNVYQWGCGRPTTLHDRTRDIDDDILHDRDYDVAALANNLSQAFRTDLFVTEGSEEDNRAIDRDDEDVYYNDDNAEVVISSLRLGDDQGSLFTNSNWFTFRDERIEIDNTPVGTTLSDIMDEIYLSENAGGGNSGSDDEVVVGEDEELVERKDHIDGPSGSNQNSTEAESGSNADIEKMNIDSEVAPFQFETQKGSVNPFGEAF